MIRRQHQLAQEELALKRRLEAERARLHAAEIAQAELQAQAHQTRPEPKPQVEHFRARSTRTKNPVEEAYKVLGGLVLIVGGIAIMVWFGKGKGDKRS